MDVRLEWVNCQRSRGWHGVAVFGQALTLPLTLMVATCLLEASRSLSEPSRLRWFRANGLYFHARSLGIPGRMAFAQRRTSTAAPALSR